MNIKILAAALVVLGGCSGSPPVNDGGAGGGSVGGGSVGGGSGSVGGGSVAGGSVGGGSVGGGSIGGGSIGGGSVGGGSVGGGSIGGGSIGGGSIGGGSIGGGSVGGGSVGGGSVGGGSVGGGSIGGGSAGGGSAGGGSAGGGSAGGGAAGGGSGEQCTPRCGVGRRCCGTACVNTANDPMNCGDCGVQCSGATPFCDGAGTCRPAPCSVDAGSCAGTCCGVTCCGVGQLCCDPQGPVSGAPACHTPTMTAPTCPQGCAPLCASDRAIKSDVQPIDERRVLEQVASLPLSTWRYTADPTGSRHLGPMAQDFKAAFGLGATDTAYHPIDAHGVSLASIKALYQMVQQQEARLRQLEAENRALRGRCGPQ